jgi:hypothetical protein
MKIRHVLIFALLRLEVAVLDLVVLDMSDHPAPGYQLNLAGYELYTNGKLIDKIPPG